VKPLLISSALLLLCAGVYSQNPGRKPAASVSFKKQIAPIFAANCNACHGEKMPQSGFSTFNYSGLIKGGGRGKAIIPTNAEGSLLVQYIDGKKQPRMPIGGQLKASEIALVKRWVNEGAKSDGDAAPTVAAPAIKVKAGILPQAASLAWSKDGRWLAVGTYKEVRIFDAGTSKLAQTLPGHSDVVRALAFSPDGNTLAAGGGVPGLNGEVKLWTVANWKLANTLQGHTDCIYGLAWRPDGKQIATTSYDKTVKLWDVANSKSIADLKDHADAVYSAAYSTDSKYLATASADRSIRVWDANTGKRLYTLAGHTEMVTALAFHPTLDQLVTAGADKAVRLWNLKPDGGDNVRTFAAQPDIITDIRFAPDGKTFATASNDGTIRIWDPGKNEAVRSIPASTDALLSICFAPTSQSVAAGGYDGSVRVFKTADGTAQATLIAAPPGKAAAGR
jgi:WD40 repeat protein